MAKKIPFVQQLEITDCGAACLAMSLAFHGRHIDLDEARAVTETGRDGVDALSLVRAARSYGMQARGVGLEVEGLEHLDQGSILHWGFNHFVVFDRVSRKGVAVVDPALGHRLIPLPEFSKEFTGVAVTLQPGEDFQASKGRRSKGVWRYLRPMLSHRGLLARIFATSLLIQVFAIAVPVLTGVIVDRIVPQSNESLLVVLSMALAVMVLFLFATSFVRSHLLLHLRTHLDLRISLGFMDHLVELPYRFFLQRSAGDLMMRVNSNQTVRELLTTSAASSLLDGTLVLSYLVFLLLANLWFGSLVLALAGLQVGVLALSRKLNQRLMTESLQAQARSQAYLAEVFAGIETLKVMGAEDRSVENWTNLFAKEVNVGLARGRLSAIVDSAISALRIASPLAILTLGTVLVLNDEMSLGTMLALSALAGGFLMPLGALVTTFLQLQLLGSYMERINDVLESPKEQDRSQALLPTALSGHIVVDGVSFRYSPNGPDVVSNVSFEIEPGQKVAIVGLSGSGKSTLAALILGLFSPTEGRILYDGEDLARLDVTAVRRQIGVVTQQSYLFGTSIRQNIALTDPSLPLDAVTRAAKLAHIHEDIASWPLGYETALSDGGASLSGGQRQRIALARALVRSPSILILDEATSALDTITERHIYQELSGLKSTIIVIAHRMSTITQADRIFVMNEGSFVEQGTHEELLKAGGMYARLVSTQVDGRG